jgi:hypothetical protein
MDRFPTLPGDQGAPDPVEDAIAEVDGAIVLILTGVARAVQLYGLPGAGRATAVGAAHAQEAGLAFRIERDRRGGITLIVGPKLHG